jgi:hypothetical protein
MQYPKTIRNLNNASVIAAKQDANAAILSASRARRLFGSPQMVVENGQQHDSVHIYRDWSSRIRNGDALERRRHSESKSAERGRADHQCPSRTAAAASNARRPQIRGE